MATAASTSCMWLVVVSICVGCVVSTEKTENSQDELAVDNTLHNPQKRSAILNPVISPYAEDGMEGFADDRTLVGGPYDTENDINKRTLFRFGKRGSIFRFGKRSRGSLLRFGKRGTLLRFGKRGGSLLRFGRSGGEPQNSNGNLFDDEADKRSLFRFGKRSDEDVADLLEDLKSYYALSDDVEDSKRSVNSFHWGESEK